VFDKAKASYDSCTPTWQIYAEKLNDQFNQEFLSLNGKVTELEKSTEGLTDVSYKSLIEIIKEAQHLAFENLNRIRLRTTRIYDANFRKLASHAKIDLSTVYENTETTTDNDTI